MKKILLSLIALPALTIALVGCSHPRPAYYPPPPEQSEVARHGFHDGVDAARRDMSRGMRPDADRHPRFRNPPVPYGPAAEEYRESFRRGYRSTYHEARED